MHGWQRHTGWSEEDVGERSSPFSNPRMMRTFSPSDRKVCVCFSCFRLISRLREVQGAVSINKGQHQQR